IEEHRRALDDARRIGDRGAEVRSLWMLGMANKVGHVDEAVTLWTAGLALAREIGDRRHEGQFLAWQGVVAQERGRPDEARRLFEQAIELHREVGDRR